MIKKGAITVLLWWNQDNSELQVYSQRKPVKTYCFTDSVKRCHNWWISVEDNNETEKKYGVLVYQIEILTTTHIPLTDQINRLLQKHLPLAVLVG